MDCEDEKDRIGLQLQLKPHLTAEHDPAPQIIKEVNASGHADKLQRQYGLLSTCAAAITIDNAWVAMGASLVVASANGGPPGIIYEFLAACIYYCFIAASLAELASSIPSSGGVYHWASVTPGRRSGRMLGFFAGWLNFFGWFMLIPSGGAIVGNICVQMYALFHPSYVPEPWHVYVTSCIYLWSACFFVIFCNRLLPALQLLAGFICVFGNVVTVVVLLSMPKKLASHSFVWTDWTNATGWPSGLAFLMGMLNGAFTIGTPDGITHMAEEMPNPRRDIPKAIACQMLTGTLSSFVFVIAVMYGIQDFGAILSSGSEFPLAQMYLQATGSRAATCGLLAIVLGSVACCGADIYITCGRTLWTLARDNVTPFSNTLGKASEKRSCPIQATLCCAIIATLFSAIQLASATAFSDMVSAFVILTTVSYALPIAGHLFTGRQNIVQGPFWMGKWGLPVNVIALLSITITNVIYCFPLARPFNTSTMNYSAVILAGCIFLPGVWWIVDGRQNYKGVVIPHMEDAKRLVEDGI